MMRPHLPLANRTSAPASRASDPTPEELFRALISQLPLSSSNDKQALGASAQDTDEIVIDTEIDGFRYFLVRSPKSTHSQVALSPREKEIVRMVAQGHPNKVIAGVLNISSWTVCTHLRRVFAKLGVGSRAAMVARLLELGGVRSSSHEPHAPSSAPSVSGASVASRGKTSEIPVHQPQHSSASRRTA
jgi:two-component system nitrate/nitrite response regulator NarL